MVGRILEYLFNTAEKGGVFFIPVMVVSVYAWYLIIVKLFQLKKEKFPDNPDKIKKVVFSFGDTFLLAGVSRKLETSVPVQGELLKPCISQIQRKRIESRFVCISHKVSSM